MNPAPAASSGTTKLVVVFNHRYEGNIDILEDLYRNRFETTYLMPFYRGAHPKVVPVYDSSHYFHAFVAQAYRDYRDPRATHYAFAGDDLFLNPLLDSENMGSMIGLPEDAGYVKTYSNLAGAPFAWSHLVPAVKRLSASTGVNYHRELPDKDEAHSRVARHIDPVYRIGRANLDGFDGKLHLHTATARRSAAFFLRHPKLRTVPYPLLWGYSDLFVVPATAMDDFVHYCSVFAAMRLFVEIAIPTALALACSHIRTESHGDLTGIEVWHGHEQQQLVDRFGGSIRRLTDEFPPDWLYVHPIKLSKWSSI